MDSLALLEGEYVREFCILLSCAFGMPVPEEIALLSAGVFVATQKLKLHQAILAGITGVLMSDIIVFFLGRQLKCKIFHFRLIQGLITESRLTKAQSYLFRNAALSCFLGRFIPGFRVVIFATAGMLNVRPILFLIVDILAAIIDVSFWIFMGKQMGLYVDAFQYSEELKIAVMLIGLSFLLLSAIRQYISRC